MLKINGWLFAFVLLVVGACRKEAALTPSPIEIQYKLPQGNNPFDTAMVAFQQRYGSFFLYKFTQLDFGWMPVNSSGSSTSNGLMTSHACDTADVSAIGKVLPFVRNNWLDLYPDALLKVGLPYKVLLAKNLRTLPLQTKINTVIGYNHITISNFSEAFDTMGIAAKAAFRQDLHATFWNWMLTNNKVLMAPGFLTASNYTQAGVTTANMYQYGFLSPMIPALSTKVINDELDYIKAITGKTKAQLEATILDPATDVKGLIRLKYNAIIAYYKTNFNLDLQQIGEKGLVP